MTENTLATMRPELSVQDARALRHADSLCFDHLADGTGRIRAILRADHSPTGFEQTHEILAESSRVTDYEKTSHDGAYTGFAMEMGAKYEGYVVTVVRHLRAGSRFVLVWTRDNSSPVTREAGLVVDSVQIRIQAPRSARADSFNLRTYVGYDNSARMVRRVK